MSEKEIELYLTIGKLYTTHDEDGKLLFTQIPHGLMEKLTKGDYSAVETRIILFIARLTCGFHNKGESCYLGVDDFVQATGITAPYFSTTIRKMLKDGKIFRSTKNGEKYKYAINLLDCGYAMKYYRKVNAGYKLSNEEYTFDNENYTFCKKADVVGDEFVYKSTGFDNDKKLQIKLDRNSNINLDIEDGSVDDASASSLGASSAEAVKSKSSTTPKSNGATAINAIDSGASDIDQKLEALLDAFENEILNNDISLYVPIAVKHMHILKNAGYPQVQVTMRWCKMPSKFKKMELYKVDYKDKAVQIFQEERKAQGFNDD